MLISSNIESAYTFLHDCKRLSVVVGRTFVHTVYDCIAEYINSAEVEGKTLQNVTGVHFGTLRRTPHPQYKNGKDEQSDAQLY